VILAAGRSTRLQTVTGGGSKALVRVGGLSLLERAVRALHVAGLDRVVVVVGYHAGPVAAVARRASPRVEVVVAEEWEEGNAASLSAAESAMSPEPSFLLVTADHLFSPGALDDLLEAGEPSVLVDPAAGPEVWEEATRVEVDEGGQVLRLGKDVDAPLVDCGAFLLDGAVFRAVRRAREAGRSSLAAALSVLPGLRAIPIRSQMWWQDVDTSRDLDRAKAALRRSLGRPGDGPVARHLNRRLSIPLSWALAPLRPPPALLSWLALAVVVAGGALLASGLGVAGGILVQTGSVLDGVDGEVARLALRASPHGALLDGFLDRLSDAAVAGGLGVWAVSSGTRPVTALLLAVGATMGAMLSMAIKDRIIALELRGPSERELGWLLGGRDGRLLVVAILAVAGQPAVALAVTGATSLVTSGIRVALTRRPKAGLA
jgi:CDP-L-myo-inositol myo-inositolphosphotransferase